MSYSLTELSKYSLGQDTAYQDYPEITDYFMLFNDILKTKKLTPRVLGISGVYPPRKSRKVHNMRFVTINTNKTYFAAIKEVQSIFGIFYLESGIMPDINCLPKSFLRDPKEVSSQNYKALMARGVFIYGS